MQLRSTRATSPALATDRDHGRVTRIRASLRAVGVPNLRGASLGIAHRNYRALDGVGAPVRRTVATAIATFGVDKSARGDRVVRLDANGLRSAANRQHGDLEFRQGR